MKAKWAILVFVFLAGCATDSLPETPTHPVKIVCLPMVTYSQADLDQFAEEVAKLQPTEQKQVVRFLGDYKAMREANRACHATP